MIERLIENWLDSASERSYQAAFCHMLQSEGFSIIHSTRHSPIELGTDILARDSDGVLCGFQLKGHPGKKLKKREWQSTLQPQVFELLTNDPIHPSVKDDETRRSFFVTNGGIEEEAQLSIRQFNETMSRKIDQTIEVWSRERLLEMALGLGSKLFPSELPDAKNFLELYLENGKCHPKLEKFEKLFSDILFDQDNPNISVPEAKRRLSSCALLAEIGLNEHKKAENHFAQIGVMTVLRSNILKFATQLELDRRAWKGTLAIVEDSILSSLFSLLSEVSSRKDMYESDVIIDSAHELWRFRLTWVIGLLSIFGLHQKINDGPSDITDNIELFLKKYKNDFRIWGESSIPMCLALFWHQVTFDATIKPNSIIFSLLRSIITSNSKESKNPLPNPYYSDEDVINRISDSFMTEKEEPLYKENFNGRSYYADGLIHLLARRNFKQSLQKMWYQISDIDEIRFEPIDTDSFYSLRSQKGKFLHLQRPRPQNWEELKKVAKDDKGDTIPELLKENPLFALLHLFFYPHRVNSSFIRWLDSELYDKIDI